MDNIASELDRFTQAPLKANWARVLQRTLGLDENMKRKPGMASLLEHVVRDASSTSITENAHMFARTDSNTSLIDIILEHRYFECSITLDHAFALLGLVKDGSKMQVEYSLRPADLPTQVWANSRDMSSKALANIGRVLRVS